MKKTKLALNSLKVESFVTKVDKATSQTAKAGANKTDPGTKSGQLSCLVGVTGPQDSNCSCIDFCCSGIGCAPGTRPVGTK